MREQLWRSSTRRSGLWAVTIVVALAGCSSAGTVGSSSSNATTSTTVPASAVPSSTDATTSTSASTPLTTVPATAGSTSTTPPTSVGHVPPAVAVISAAPGGGSGEVVVHWNAVSGATGYRVERASSATGPYERVATFDITTGRATVVAGVVNLWSSGYSYVPAGSAGSLPDRSPWFEYVEYPVDGTRCYRVAAVNAAGRSPYSPVVCSGPPA